jgi:hypothetical protein
MHDIITVSSKLGYATPTGTEKQRQNKGEKEKKGGGSNKKTKKMRKGE